MIKLNEINKISVFLCKIFLSSINFLLQTLLGGIIFGIFPAYSSLVKIFIEQNLRELSMSGLIKIQWKNYLFEFKDVTLLLWRNYILIFFLLYGDGIISWNNQANFFNLQIVMKFLVVFICLINIYMVFCFQKGIKKYLNCFSNAFLLVFFSPWTLIKIFILLFGVGYLDFKSPLFLILFGGYIGSGLVTRQLEKTIRKVKRLQLKKSGDLKVIQK